MLRATTVLWLAAGALQLVACYSMPILPKLSSAEANVVAAPTIGKLSAAAVTCTPPSPEMEAVCEHDIPAVRELLLATGIFTSLDADPGEADVTISLVPTRTRPYWSTPAHNPAALLLSLAIPFWWSDTLGQQFLVEHRASGRTGRIDMRREGTYVMWVLAPVLNLSPNRAFMPNLNREANHLRLHIITFLQQ